MAETLNLFPQRAAIGRVDARGNVYMTDEFTRALAALLVRVGGPNGNDLGDLAVDLAGSANAASLAAARGVAALELELAQAVHLSARLAELRKQVTALELELVKVAPLPDWEHPGKIGAAAPNTGTFTTVNRVKITAPGNLATFTLLDGKTFSVGNTLTLAGADGKTFTLSNTLGLAGNDGAALNIGAGGTLGTAAFAAASSFAGRPATTLGAPATDPTTTTNLANNMRVALLAAGIGT